MTNLVMCFCFCFPLKAINSFNSTTTHYYRCKGKLVVNVFYYPNLCICIFIHTQPSSHHYNSFSGILLG